MAQPTDPLVALAERVAEVARREGVKTAVIGAAAMAHHGYVRATVDIDLAACTTLVKLRAVAAALESSLGPASVQLREPGDDDPLAGVLSVRASPEDEDVVQVVNLPSTPAFSTAVRTSVKDGALSFCRVPNLVLLKLYAGSRFDVQDAAELVSRHPSSLAEIEATCPDDLQPKLVEMKALIT